MTTIWVKEVHGSSVEDAWEMWLELAGWEANFDHNSPKEFLEVKRPGPIPAIQLCDWILRVEQDPLSVPKRYRLWAKSMFVNLFSQDLAIALPCEYKAAMQYKERHHLKGRRGVQVYRVMGRLA